MKPSLIDNIISNAFKNHKNKKFSEAEKLYAEVLKIDPNHIICLNYFGVMLAQTNRTDRAEKLFLKANNIQPNNPFVNNNLGNIYYENGDYNKAILYYEAAISFKSDFIDPNLNLGIILINQGNLEKALDHLKRVIQIQPTNIKSYAIIASIYKKQKNFKRALDSYKKIYEIDPENLLANTGVVDLFNTSNIKNLTKNNSKELIEIFTFLYKKNSINHNLLFSNVKKVIIFEENYLTIENLDKDETSFLSENLVISVLKKELFHLVLQKSLVTDKFFEKFLYTVRKEFLFLLKKNEISFIHKHFNFILSIASQSFLNEYILFQSKEEISFVETLKNKIEKSKDIHEVDIALLACYLPLNQSEILIQKLFNYKSSNNLFNDIIKMQIKDILEEKKLKKTINSIEITDQVSKKVKEQYEENPYPRWRNINKISPTNFFTNLNNDIRPNQIFLDKKPITNNILIAGCGTGQQLATHISYQDSNILAVDISLSSLALAKRKMNELNSKNVEFLHSDLLNLKKIKKKFNVVECVGVLHHLDDPEFGLNILLDLLESQGYLKLGLYSELARKHIVQTRDFIKKYNFKNSINDIRNCRELLKNKTNNNFLAKLTNNYDFYTSSGFRDLILHVKEHHFTLPKISKLLQKYNLQFLGFTNASIKKDYSMLYKDDKKHVSLKNWHEFETKYPDIFQGMYQFWVKKN